MRTGPGIVADDQTDVLTGQDLVTLDDAALQQRVTQVRVYARVDPAQKIRIVEALQAQGQIVAMAGDGVNDAPMLLLPIHILWVNLVTDGPPGLALAAEPAEPAERGVM